MHRCTCLQGSEGLLCGGGRRRKKRTSERCFLPSCRVVNSCSAVSALTAAFSVAWAEQLSGPWDPASPLCALARGWVSRSFCAVRAPGWAVSSSPTSPGGPPSSPVSAPEAGAGLPVPGLLSPWPWRPPEAVGEALQIPALPSLSSPAPRRGSYLGRSQAGRGWSHGWWHSAGQWSSATSGVPQAPSPPRRQPLQ